MRLVRPYAVFDGKALLADAVLVLENNRVTDLLIESNTVTDQPVETYSGYIAPGLVDIQVNGGGGVMLNNQPTPEGVQAIALAHRSLGVSFLAPTVITDTPDVIERAAFAVLEELGNNGVVGLHIEGPHISVAHKGTHRAELIRPFDSNTLQMLERLRKRELPIVLTLAPECVPPETISTLSELGVIMSAGHTKASAEITCRAIEEGLRGFTHLFNGMPAMLPRKPGIVGTAINSHCWCGFIADGHHVDDEMVKLAIRARPKEHRMVLVSDAMSTIGGPDHFKLYGESIQLRDGRLVNANGSLAGAHITLLDSVKRLINELSIDPETAIKMATVNPREFLRLPQQSIIGSEVTDLSWVAIEESAAMSGANQKLRPESVKISV